MKLVVVLVWMCFMFYSLVGCEDSAVKSPVKDANVRTICYKGVEYFTMWNNNAFERPYITGAVIDPSDLKPKRCETE